MNDYSFFTIKTLKRFARLIILGYNRLNFLMDVIIVYVRVDVSIESDHVHSGT